MKKQSYFILLTFLLFVSIIVAGCGSSSTSPDSTAPGTSSNDDQTSTPDDGTAQDSAGDGTAQDSADDGTAQDSADDGTVQDGADDGTAQDNADDGSTQVNKDYGIFFTEIMYNPGGDSPEFLELVNTGDESVDISGFTFTKGIEYTFEPGTVLGPGEIIVLSDVDPDKDNSLKKRLPEEVRLFAPYDGQMDNGGEEIELRDGAGKKVCSVTYDDESPWPVSADGFGYSIVVADSTLSTWGSFGQDWLASAKIDGAPGTLSDADVMTDMKVRINEALTHTDTPGGDAIELYNDSATAVDVSGWYLSDDKKDYDKFKIPDGTVIEPYNYLVFYEIDDPDNKENIKRFLFGKEFQLSAHEDGIFLFAANDGELSGYAHGFSFGEVENNISFGRYVNASGKIQFIAQKDKTLGAENAGPYVGYIVISEIMYHADGDVAPCNFVEITNTGNNAMTLFDPDHPGNTWAINGIDFSFEGEVTIRSDERIVLIEKQMVSVKNFREFYNLGDDIQVYEYKGSLKGSRETLEVMKPEDPLDKDDVPCMVVDRAGYDEDNPGLEAADGSGVSLERIDLKAYGDDYTNWTISEPGGTPGH